MAIQFQLRRGTAAQWTGNNTVLANGEPGFEYDTKKIKVGDGTTAWSSLAYLDVTVGNINTAIQYANNNSLGANSQLTYIHTSATLTVGNTSSTLTPSIKAQNSISVAYLNSDDLVIGNSSVTTTPTIILQNSSTNSTLTSLALTLGASSLVANTTGVYHTGVVNAALHTVGSSFTANATVMQHTGSVNAASGTITTNTFNIGSSNAASSTAASNGYARLPNGLLMIWGTHSAVFSSGTVITFNTAAGTPFSVNCFSVTACPNVNPATYGGVGVYSINATAFTAIAACTSTISVTWMAIGR